MLELGKVYCMDCLDGIKQIVIPDLIIADPPYQFQAEGGGLYKLARTERMLNKIHKMGCDSFDFDKFIPPLLNLQEHKVNAYFFCNKTLIPNYLFLAKKRDLLFDILIFKKLNPLPAFHNSYMNELEYVIFLRSRGVYFSSTEGYSNYKKVYSENIGHHGLIHPNQKPIELIRRYIRVSSKINGVILDPFAGCGTVSLASKQLNRRCVGFELISRFVDIANSRVSKSISKSLLLFD